MLVYADHPSDHSGPAQLHAVRRALDTLCAGAPPSHDRLVAALVDLGALESGVADILQGDEEAHHPLLAVLRRASEAVGLAVAASWTGGRPPANPLRHAAAALDGITPAALPARVPLRLAEGYAFYAVYPESYVEVALEWLAHHQPEAVICLGLRTIGSSLSAVVHGAATLAGVPAHSWTLRPRGHPFDRHVRIAPMLARRWPLDRAVVIVTDEGPGLSGSSLAGTAAALSDLGVPDDRIVLLAAWEADATQLRSSHARHRWSRHHVLAAPFARVGRRVRAMAGVPADATDVSAGRWRHGLSGEDAWPAVQPQHERMKYRTADGRIVRFAGRGRYGEAVQTRAAWLSAHGWTSPPGDLRLGFLSQSFVPGAPLRAYDDATACHAARYVGWLRTHAATGATAATDAVVEMLVTNAGMALGDAGKRAATRLADQARAFMEPAVAIDGRLQPHEWVRGPEGLVKTDALDHHRDHFLPGPTDAAWDVAGLLVEGRLAREAAGPVVAAYVDASGDAAIRHRLPFHLAAYAALRVGYCTLAETAVDDAERRRFRHARTRYLDALRTALDQPSAFVPGGRTLAREGGRP